MWVGQEVEGVCVREVLEVKVEVCIVLQALDEGKRGEMVDRKLWIEENYITYKSEQDEINRVKMAESSKHKMMR